MKILNADLLEKNIESIAQLDLSENNLFGSSYLVRQNGKKIYEKYFGVTDPKSGVAVSESTLFRLASMTKPVTAVAILILINRGLISLSDPVKKYLPQFENVHIISEDGTDLGKATTDITVLHLLTHTSGFGSLKPCNDMTDADKATIDATIDYFLRQGLDFEPFTCQAYSGIAAFDVLAKLVEQITGEDYEAFLQHEIFHPCGMKDTTFLPSAEQEACIITMHNKVDGKSCVGNTTPHCAFDDYPYEHKMGGAGLVSTLSDYSRFAELLLNRGRVGETQIASAKLFDLLFVPQVPFDIMPWNERWGLGGRVVTEKAYGVLPIGSYGWYGAFGSAFWVDPENNITAVLMKNSHFDGGAGNQSACRFEKAVHDALNGEA